MNGFKYQRGNVLIDVGLSAAKSGHRYYRVERLLLDHNTGVRLYVIRPVHGEEELLRSAKLIENDECFTL